MKKAHDHVGHLYAGVVNVVVNLDVFAGCAQDARRRVAEHRVTHVADVRGLVRIDRSMFDDELSRLRILDRWSPVFVNELREYPGSVEKDIQVSRAGDFDSGDAGHCGQTSGQLRSQLAWVLLLAGRGLDAFGQIE